MSDWKEIQEVAYTHTKKGNRQLPYFSPWVWKGVLAITFIIGLFLGVGLAIYILHIRGLW